MQEYRLVRQYKNQQGKFVNDGIIISGEVRVLGKHCATLSMDDHQEQIKKLILLVAKKESMINDTEFVAISDGAANCWNVIDHLQDDCKLGTYQKATKSYKG